MAVRRAVIGIFRIVTAEYSEYEEGNIVLMGSWLRLNGLEQGKAINYSSIFITNYPRQLSKLAFLNARLCNFSDYSSTSINQSSAQPHAP